MGSFVHNVPLTKIVTSRVQFLYERITISSVLSPFWLVYREGKAVDGEEEEEEEGEEGEEVQQRRLGLILELMAMGKEEDPGQVC